MTRAITALLDIMNDTEAPLRRRIEAAAGLLDFEAPSEIADAAKNFLTSVFEDTDRHVDDRLDALKLMRKSEARKITQPTVSAADERANREQARRLEVARRRVALVEAGMWPPEKGWADDLLGDSYVAPPGSQTPTDMYEAVRQARERATKPEPSPA